MAAITTNTLNFCSFRSSSSSCVRFLLFLVCLQICSQSLLLVCATSDDELQERFRRDALDDLKKDIKLVPKKASYEKKDLAKSAKLGAKASATNAANHTEVNLTTVETTDNLDLKYINEDELFANSTDPNQPIANETAVVDTKNHKYFTSTYMSDPKLAMSYWINLDTLPKSQIFVHEILSDSHRRAASIQLPFKFPFYGNNITRATIATGGFLYMGEHVHSWLAATQYIAPLMANFDTRNSSHSLVRYGFNSSVFVIQWERVRLQENQNVEFTFQCALHTNGDIAFVYKDIPISIAKIPDSGHPVKIGVSDAYFINRAQAYVRRKTIYEYHKVDMINQTIHSQTALYLKALPTCTSLKSCNSCLTQKIGFECVWCAAVGRCSDGYDRQRQEWITRHCETNHTNLAEQCEAEVITASTVNNTNTTEHPNASTPSSESSNSTAHSSVINTDHDTNKSIDLHNDSNLTQLEYDTHHAQRMERVEINNGINKKKSGRSQGSGIMLSLFFLVSIVAGFGLWVLYAYRNPTSSSGQFMIRWRPSSWRWNSAETRYTAASIHM